MRAKSLLLLLALNILLFGLAVGLFVVTVEDTASDVSAPAPDAAEAAARVRARLASARPRTAPPAPAAPAKVVYVTNQFHWSQVESPDYREYIANLRAVGCPETTLKDIILTDIMRLYAARRGQFYHNGREFKYWETDEKRKLKTGQLEERERQLAQIDKEIPAVLRELLGINYEREVNKYFVDTFEDDRRLAFLPEDTRNQLAALRDEFEGRRERVLQRAADGRLTDADRAELRRIEDERLARLAQMLPAGQLEEYELAVSATADRLRSELVGFNPTETEFREIYRLQKALDDHYAFADMEDADVQRRKAEDEAGTLEEIRRRLGENRFAEYQQSQTPGFRDLAVFAEVNDLPASTAGSILEIKQIAERERQNLLATPGIAPENRDEALRAIQTETEKNIGRILGHQLMADYARMYGGWIRELAPE